MPDSNEIFESGDKVVIRTTVESSGVTVRGDNVSVRQTVGDNVTLTEGDKVTTVQTIEYVVVDPQSPDKILISEKGSPGPPGTDKHYLHEQNTPAATWIINHGLNKFPSVSPTDSANTVVEGCVSHIDRNNLIITFSSQFSGRAYLN